MKVLFSSFARFFIASHTLLPRLCWGIGFGFASSALAVTNDELLPAALIGKTFYFVNSQSSRYTLDSVASYMIQLTSATTFGRTAPDRTSTGAYFVLVTTTSRASGERLTSFVICSGWTATKASNGVGIAGSISIGSPPVVLLPHSATTIEAFATPAGGSLTLTTPSISGQGHSVGQILTGTAGAV